MADEILEREVKQKLSDLYAGEGRVRVESEIVLPEYKEEAQRILRMTTLTRVNSKNVYLRAQNLICEVEGTVSFQVLYLTDRRGEKGVISSFLSQENFSYTFKIPYHGEEMDTDQVTAFVELVPEGAVSKLQGPRKISTRCDVAVALDLKCNTPVALYPAFVAQDIKTSGKKAGIARLAAVHTEEMNFSETISLPKAYLPIQEVCEMDVSLIAQNVKAEEGGVRFTGLCDLHCSYTAQGEDLFVSFYQPIEFEKSVGVADVTSSHFCQIHMTPNFLKASTDVNEEGENKNILFELSFTCEVLAFENQETDVVEDAFSTESDLVIRKEREQLEEILGMSDFSVTVRDSVPLKNPSVFRAEGILSSVEFKNSYWEEGKIVMEGKLSYRYLGVEETGEMKNYEESYDFRCDWTPEKFSLPAGEECRIEISGLVRSLDLEPEGEKMRLRFDLGGSVTVYLCRSVEIVSDMERGEKWNSARGGILYVYPQEGESLWDIAKKYHVAPEEISRENGLEGVDLPTFLRVLPF